MIVLRAPDLNFKFEGWWYDDPLKITLSGDMGLDPAYEYVIVTTDKMERRDDDGATAQVYEVRRVPTCGVTHPHIDGGKPCAMEPNHYLRQGGTNIHVTANGLWWEDEVPADG